MTRDGTGQGASCGHGWAAEGRGVREGSRDADGQGMSPLGYSFSNSNLCRNHTGKLLKSWFWFTTFEAASKIIYL